MLNKFLLTGLILNTFTIFADKPIVNESNITTQNNINDDLDISEATLDNGIKIYVIRTNTKGTVSGGVGYFVGSADDPRNVTGISHILEHMMFKGTKNLSGEKLKEISFVCNKNSNAFTSYDITFYIFLCHKSFLDMNLKIEADRMQNLKLDPKELQKEKEVVIEERKMRTESDPFINHMEEASWKAMYLFSNYSYPVIGYIDQIKECGPTEVRAHYEKFYNPQNAFVLLVGDITLDEAIDKVKTYFGMIPAGKRVDRNRVIDPENTGLTHSIEHEDENIKFNDINIVYKIDRNLFDDVRKQTIVELIVGMLSTGSSSVLYSELIDKNKTAYDIGSYLDIRAFDKGRLNISAMFHNDKKVNDVDNAIMQTISDFIDKHLTKERFENEKKKYLDQLEINESDPNLMLMYGVSYITNGYKMSEFKKIRSIIRSITFEETKDIAQKILNKKNRIMRIYSHPKGK